MNTFVLEIWDDEANKVTFYTVRKENARQNETDRFFNKYDAIAEFKRPVQELLSFVLDSVGEDHGAIDVLFNRFENEVVGLPNKGKVNVGGIVFLYPNFPLRLYALRINGRSDLVVLFNGGVKSAQTNQGSRDLNLKWIEACQFAKRIEEAIRDKEIIIDNRKRKIISPDGSDEIIL
ncbi:hypothetical protein Q4E93_15025 [Flavitalea sp. BT771]|uniref:hypothetical protein n=1 Tax=Flavitalea sp. BT771 TaxID=3063329 RepID=UPI0026E46759|nr:hypothetical protein [Flavitalea sp. BT771]MDO6431917.1 hypothetical protein [Flavitalea sp. BT771]MDV6220826.1 hypothetical protein [Flavitalea sp. BT771]